MNATEHAQHLLNFIDNSPSPSHAVHSMVTELKAADFIQLNETEAWNLKIAGRYYVVRDDSSLIAFIVGQNPLAGFKIAGAHTDSPTLKIKPNPVLASDGLLRLGVEIYGGAILATFSDRDLSLAGRVSYKNDNKIKTQLIRFEQALLRLPNLAIHLNRNVNEDGLKLQKQNELPLILSQIAKTQLPDDYFATWLQQTFDIQGKVLSWDLNVYDTQKGSFWGANNEFITNSQLDNLASCHAIITALLQNTVSNPDNTLVCGFFDHEEIGSESHKGADGNFLENVLQRIVLATEHTAQHYLTALANSFMISADMAHAYQPNFPSVYDSCHKLLINQGIVIKSNANQRYSTNSYSEALFIDCCEKINVPYQHYSHRNDLACGSTIGPMTASRLGIHTVDIGSPLWAMHSIRESAGVFDHHYMIQALTAFFKH